VQACAKQFPSSRKRRPSDGCAGFEDAGGIRASSAQGGMERSVSSDVSAHVTKDSGPRTPESQIFAHSAFTSH